MLGWTWHARQQRMALPDSVIARRVRDGRHFHDTTSQDEAWTIARRYDIRYVIVGRLERLHYEEAGLAKYDADGRWRRVFSHGVSRIYERVD